LATEAPAWAWSCCKSVSGLQETKASHTMKYLKERIARVIGNARHKLRAFAAPLPYAWPA
jgi:hypothetical protein